MPADLQAVLIGPLFVVELQLLGRGAVVVPYRLGLLRRGLAEQLRRKRDTDEDANTDTEGVLRQVSRMFNRWEASR